jgi:hypothetical protein
VTAVDQGARTGATDVHHAAASCRTARMTGAGTKRG